MEYLDIVLVLIACLADRWTVLFFITAQVATPIILDLSNGQITYTEHLHTHYAADTRTVASPEILCNHDVSMLWRVMVPNI